MFIPLIDDIEIDRETHLVKDAKHNIHLTKLEFGLLDFLATHANRVCTRNDLFKLLFPIISYLCTIFYSKNGQF